MKKYALKLSVADFAEQLFKGVKAMHDAGLSHLDIKSDNYMIIENEHRFVVKLIDVLGGYDFGNGSPEISYERAKGLHITQKLLPPEYSRKFSVVDFDMWKSTLAIVFFVDPDMNNVNLIEYFPEDQEDWNIVLEMRIHGYPTYELYEKSKTCFLFRKVEIDLSKFSSELIDFLCEMTRPKPEERYHNKEIDIFSHPLFGKNLQNRKKVTRFSFVPWTPSRSFEAPPFKHNVNYVRAVQMDINDLSAPIKYYSRGDLSNSRATDCQNLHPGLELELKRNGRKTSWMTQNVDAWTIQNQNVDVEKVLKTDLDKRSQLDYWKNFPRANGLLTPFLLLEGDQIICFVTSQQPKEDQTVGYDDVYESTLRQVKQNEVAWYVESVRNMVRGLSEFYKKGGRIKDLSASKLFFGLPKEFRSSGLVEIGPFSMSFIEGLSEEKALEKFARATLYSISYPSKKIDFCIRDKRDKIFDSHPLFRDFICRARDRNMKFEEALQHPFLQNALRHGEGWVPSTMYKFDLLY